MISQDPPLTGDGVADVLDAAGYVNGTLGPLKKFTGTAFIPRKLRVLMVGAGVSGIQFAKDVSSKMQEIDLEIYDKNPALGGTWYENRYPGCACDVPAHTYQFSWEPNPRWSKFYAPAAEICEYLNDVVDKHDLRKYMHFNHKVVQAEWLESSSTWKIDLEATDSDGKTSVVTRECDIFLKGIGTLNNWRWPDIDGLHGFKGHLMHTANWDESVDLTGKTVAVIGNGASGVQCVAALQPNVKQLWNYMRTSSWMLPHVFSGGNVQSDYTKEEKERFANDPEFYYEYRRQLEVTLAGGFEALWRGSIAQEDLKKTTLKHMAEKIKDPKTLKALSPTFEIGCRRFTPGDHYLHALQQDNCTIVSDKITRITESGIVDETGVERKIDAIICCTGFDASYEPRFPTYGINGYPLSANWGRDKPTESYMGTCVANFPNLFVFMAPICPVLGSAFPGIESTSDYIRRLIERIQIDRIKSLTVKQEAQTMFNVWAQSRMQEMAWSGNCKSWYKNSKGKVFIPWPGTAMHYVETTKIIRWEDFDYVFEDPKNKYASLGNGIPSLGVAPEYPVWLGLPPSFELVQNGLKIPGHIPN